MKRILLIFVGQWHCTILGFILVQLELLKAVTSFTNGDADVPERDKTEIFEAVADHLDVLMKIMEQKKDPAALHAAETVVNMLTNNEVL